MVHNGCAFFKKGPFALAALHGFCTNDLSCNQGKAARVWNSIILMPGKW